MSQDQNDLPREPTSWPRTQPSSMAITTQLPFAISSHLRRDYPSHIQTTSLHPYSSASITPSSGTDMSFNDLLIMTPDFTGTNTGPSSVQGSPERRHLGQDNDSSPTPLVLPDPVLSSQASISSLVQQNGPSVSTQVAEPAPSQKKFFRRLSTRNRNTPSRRQSSVTPKPREESVGPAIIRRRRDSTNTAPNDYPVGSDSEDDYDRPGVAHLDSPNGLDSPTGQGRSQNASALFGGSFASARADAGLVVPPSLLHGTFVFKVKPKSKKRIALSLDRDNARLVWDKKYVEIAKIREIRREPDTSQTRLDCSVPELEKERFFSIIYDRSGTKAKKKMLNVLCDDEETQRNWTETLNQITTHLYQSMASLSAFHDRAVRQYWESEMSKKFHDDPHMPHEEEMDYAGVEALCKHLHIWLQPSQIQQHFQAADVRKTGRLNYTEFLSFIGLMKYREDIASIHVAHSLENSDGMTFNEFLVFLKDTQGENVNADRSKWEKIFIEFTKSPMRQNTGEDSLMGVRMSVSQLTSFLTSVQNPPLKAEPACYSLNRPLNEYFISSSHNTYLLGRQVASRSTVEGYIAALLGGCRCVEVDCWDGSDGFPVVKHGFLTTTISFREVINTINNYAFADGVSKFPLFISLEVHCCPAQQDKMVSIMKEIFGSKLVTEPLDPNSDRLPSPSELMGRILIKVKKPSKVRPGTESTGRLRGQSLTSPRPSSPLTRPYVLDYPTSVSSPNSPMLSPSLISRSSSTALRRPKPIAEEIQDGSSSSGSSSGSEWDMMGDSTPPIKKPASVKIIQALGQLGVYSQGIKFSLSALEGPDAKQPNHIFSLVESFFNSSASSRENKLAMFRHNMRYWMRVYPAQTRIRSDNFDPLIYWRRGVQMCALNWQTFDLPMQLNYAMFAAGKDRSGYVLKPKDLREFRRLDAEEATAEQLKLQRPRKQVRFSIEVVSAQQLTSTAALRANRSFNPYIEVEIYHANDKRDKKEDRSSVLSPVENLRACTSVAKANGFNPVFNSKFEFVVTTKFPELIFVRWVVRLSVDGANPNPIGDKTPPLAVYTAKLESLNQGYRTLPLYNQHGDKYLFSTLFCRTSVDEISQVFLPCRDERSDANKLKVIRSILTRTSTSSKNLESKTMDSMSSS